MRNELLFKIGKTMVWIGIIFCIFFQLLGTAFIINGNEIPLHKATFFPTILNVGIGFIALSFGSEKFSRPKGNSAVMKKFNRREI